MPAWLPLLLVTLAAGVAADDGRYLFDAAGCLTCHTREDGPPLAGGRAFATPYGTFFSPNISPDRESGIGAWRREQFITAIKHGTAPDGSAYFPVFPYPSYRLMTDQDAGKIFDYLMHAQPQRQANRPHDLPWWLSRWMMKPWQWWIQEPPGPGPSDPRLARGRYLVDALGHCGECHTARRLTGVLDGARYLAGNPDGPDGDKVPNITPHRDDGIGKWSADDLDYFLDSGALPNGDYTGGPMAKVIDNTTARLSASDRAAVVAYLRSIRARPDP